MGIWDIYGSYYYSGITIVVFMGVFFIDIKPVKWWFFIVDDGECSSWLNMIVCTINGWIAGINNHIDNDNCYNIKW